MAESRLNEFYREISADLERTMEFWFKYSHDTQHGGFLTCIGPKGDVYDDTKYVWFQGRQVWMYARLYNEDAAYRKPEILQAAHNGAEFLMKYAKNPETHKCYLSLTRDGRPIKIQKSIFSECFYTLAMSEMARATKEQKYRDEAILMMDKIVYWVREDGSDVRLALPALSGATPTNSLAVPMMLLCLVDQMVTMDDTLKEKYADIADWSLKQALDHVQRDGTVILENVSPSGQELPGSHGRLMVPGGDQYKLWDREGMPAEGAERVRLGADKSVVITENDNSSSDHGPQCLLIIGHSIEAGWFLLQYASKSGNMPDLKKTAIDKFILNPFKYGWDPQHGGLFYFLDVDGHSPLQLEWNMKLWWTHNETLIAFLMAYKETKDVTMLEHFATVFDYCYTKHVDRETGEWIGYLNRDGTPCMDFKGGPWKGCFHVPRALLLCKQILEELLGKK